jgi:hypothetical protein
MSNNQICKNVDCAKEYDKKLIGRQYGKESYVYILGYCSAQCYTKDILKNNVQRRGV